MAQSAAIAYLVVTVIKVTSQAIVLPLFLGSEEYEPRHADEDLIINWVYHIFKAIFGLFDVFHDFVDEVLNVCFHLDGFIAGVGAEGRAQCVVTLAEEGAGLG